MNPLRIVILGLSITSSWGNGHATIFRALMRELTQRGHEVLFLERDTPWYANNRDLPDPPWGKHAFTEASTNSEAVSPGDIRAADLVMAGSYVPDGVAVGEWVTQTAQGVTAFYDIDTPVTVAKLARGDHEYLSPELIPRYHLYLSFTGGPVLGMLEKVYGARTARAFYCAVDPELYYPEKPPERWSLGYLGTYSDDRQPALDQLLIEPARALPDQHFVVAGPQYPETIAWPSNVERIHHLPPAEHRAFYNSQRFTLNLTRAEMVRAGYSPSVRLFEAAACATATISDAWEGLQTFFEPEKEILIARTADDTLAILQRHSPADARMIGERARERVLREHAAAVRASELEMLIAQARTSG